MPMRHGAVQQREHARVRADRCVVFGCVVRGCVLECVCDTALFSSEDMLVCAPTGVCAHARANAVLLYIMHELGLNPSLQARG